MNYGGAKLLRASVLMSRTSGGDGDKPMRIIVTDELSGCRVCELYMRLDEFASALTSSSGEAEMEWWPHAPIGLKAENKTEDVPINVSPYGNAEAVAAALSPFEVDGWRARRGDMGNGHYRTKTGYHVVFFRHVYPETGEPFIPRSKESSAEKRLA